MFDVFQRAMWFCAGVDSSLARPLRTEWVTLTSVGTAVFLTAVLAFISGSYALFFVFESRSAAIAFGCLWSAVIFNFDRFVVSSMRKQSDSVSELIVAAPRALVAVIISLVIIVPLELRLFESEIEQKVSGHAVELRITYAKVVDQGPAQRAINEIDAHISQIQQELIQLEQQREKVAQDPEGARLIARIATLDALVDDLPKQQQRALLRRAEYLQKASDAQAEQSSARSTIDDLTSKSWNVRAAEQGSLARHVAAQIPATKQERDDLIGKLNRRVNVDRIDALRIELKSQEQEREKYIRQKRDLLDRIQNDQQLQKAGLLTRLEILGQLASDNKVADWTVTLIRLLVITLELSPIFIKLASPRGPYEAHLAALAKAEFPKDTP